ncbi:MAG: hypothetical protein N3I86_10605 [Verrucomicrobiae bacterium]|nr:hypothetical protein [Verrucomicrobiae bacterium]
MKASCLVCPGVILWLATLSFGVVSTPAVRAQNLLKNADFEQPLGPTNWTVVYLHGGPEDFEIKDRSRGGARRPSTFYGAYFRPLTVRLAHAYFTQTVTNLTPGRAYNFVGHMKQDWWKVDDPLRDKYKVYIELIGGQGTPLPDGRFSVIATNNLTDSSGNPEPNIEPPYIHPTIVWRPFYAQQTPDSNRCIEVRLHYDKVGFTIYDKLWIMAGSFDDLSLTP